MPLLQLVALLVASLSLVSFLVLLLFHHPFPAVSSNEPPKNTMQPLGSKFLALPTPGASFGVIDLDATKQATVRPRYKVDPHSQIIDFHFVHIPKCGGTSMTAILRQMACKIDPVRNLDCCTNPGFCDYNDNKKCRSIKGCINHLPQRPWIFESPPSITILRDPSSRTLSAWFYRGHSPNLDFFQVRPEFKEIKNGLRPKVTFEEYIEMPEYQNIQTRMLGANSFPYRNVNVTPAVFEKAVEALDAFYFVGLQEAYFISIKLLLRMTNMEKSIEAPKLRERHQKPTEVYLKLKKNKELMRRVELLNTYDYNLYEIGTALS